jgi:hypothetical protein
MILPTPTGSGLLSTHLRDLRERLDRLRPQTSPEISTDATTRGVIRRATRRGRGTGSAPKAVARWA